MKKSRRWVIEGEETVTDDRFHFCTYDGSGDMGITMFLNMFRGSANSKKILNLRGNSFCEPDTLKTIFSTISETLINIKLVDLGWNSFRGDESWEWIKKIVQKGIDVDINYNHFREMHCLSSMNKDELKRLIWLPRSLTKIESQRWWKYVNNDEEMIKIVLDTHRKFYNLPEREFNPQGLTTSRKFNNDRYLYKRWSNCQQIRFLKIDQL